jgi:glycosyltransferase involved in cell wall biosynthesis
VERELADRYRLPARTVIVHNCPPAPTEDPAAASPLRRAIGVDAGTPVVLYHGALTAVRGLRELLATIRDPRLDGVHLIFLGSGPLEEELRLASADPALRGRVHLLPPVPPDELVSWVAGADAGLMPNQPTTRNELASTPNKLFESISAGVPVVTSDFPERHRIVLEDPVGPLGEVCDPTDPADIARAVHALTASGPDIRAERRARCLRAARERWNWETEGAKLVALYASLDGGSGSSGSGSGGAGAS